MHHTSRLAIDLLEMLKISIYMKTVILYSKYTSTIILQSIFQLTEKEHFGFQTRKIFHKFGFMHVLSKYVFQLLKVDVWTLQVILQVIFLDTFSPIWSEKNQNFNHVLEWSVPLTLVHFSFYVSMTTTTVDWGRSNIYDTEYMSSCYFHICPYMSSC